MWTEEENDIWDALGPCWEARDWMESNGFDTPAEAWDACANINWMFWLFDTLDFDRTATLRAAFAAIRAFVPEIPEGPLRDEFERAEAAIKAGSPWINNPELRFYNRKWSTVESILYCATIDAVEPICDGETVMLKLVSAFNEEKKLADIIRKFVPYASLDSYLRDFDPG